MHSPLTWALALLPAIVVAQPPYQDWDLAYEAAEELVSSWTIEQRANITVRNGVAPGYIPFTTADGEPSETDTSHWPRAHRLTRIYRSHGPCSWRWCFRLDWSPGYRELLGP